MNSVPPFDEVMKLTDTISTYPVLQPPECRAIFGLDLAFIDGCHDQPVVERDLAIVASRVKPGGFLVAHDYPSAGVTEAIDPFVAHGWTKHRHEMGLGVWRRK